MESGAAINTHGLIRIAHAILEGTSVVVPWHIPLASHYVINVIAQSGSSWRILASTEAELTVGHKVRPLVHLCQRAERAREYKTANRISVAVSTVRVEFSSSIARGNIDFREITDACDSDSRSGSISHS